MIIEWLHIQCWGTQAFVKFMRSWPDAASNNHDNHFIAYSNYEKNNVNVLLSLMKKLFDFNRPSSDFRRFW